MKSKSDRVTKHKILIITIHDDTLNEHTDEISRDDTAKENVPINIDCVNGHKEDKHADNENIVNCYGCYGIQREHHKHKYRNRQRPSAWGRYTQR